MSISADLTKVTRFQNVTANWAAARFGLPDASAATMGVTFGVVRDERAVGLLGEQGACSCPHDSVHGGPNAGQKTIAGIGEHLAVEGQVRCDQLGDVPVTGHRRIWPSSS